MSLPADQIQVLLRFLAQDAKIPLAMAMQKVQELRKVQLNGPETIAKANIKSIQEIFKDEKLSKQILAAAKKACKKRTAGDSEPIAPPSKRKKKAEDHTSSTPAEIEESLELPSFEGDNAELLGCTVYTNRAPLVLAFAVATLKYTMPKQPLSSRLSLAQAVVSANSRSKAVSIGIEEGKTAEEEGWGEGQPTVHVLGRKITCLRRWGYEWNADANTTEEEVALWGLDLEALRRTNQSKFKDARGGQGQMPIHTADSARSYLLKAFQDPPEKESLKSTKKMPASAIIRQREQNAGKVLRSIELLCESYKDHLSAEDLDRRAWHWYVRVRPDVGGGAAGWGSKGEVPLKSILDLCRKNAS
ncbi:MAG: hypothetical protein M1814_005353 [Vezdaea aestivalis]|nr:MAG: hypothetical protein M1814_005353 [Vezdaea aestivalis]